MENSCKKFTQSPPNKSNEPQKPTVTNQSKESEKKKIFT